MLRNYITVALRNLLRQKGYAFINVVGLSLGLACSLLILLWVVDERSIDQYHANIDRIYRIMGDQKYSNGQILTTQSTPALVGPALNEQFPEVEAVSRASYGSTPRLYESDDHSLPVYTIDVEPAFFRIFTVEFVEGDAQNPFPTLESIILRDDVAKSLFGEAPALGKRLELADGSPLVVSGVVKSDQYRSSLDYEGLRPFDPWFTRNSWADSWSANGVRTFVLLRENQSADAFASKIAGLVKENQPGSVVDLFLHPVSDWYLYGDLRPGHRGSGLIVYVRIFTAVSLFILIIACINFVNLATARSARRSREIGVRKAMGAHKKALVEQFLMESLLVSLVSMLFALAITHLALPYFNQLTGKQMALDYGSTWLWAAIIVITLIPGLLAGLYPALYMASFDTVRILKGAIRSGRSAAQFRQALVVFQFALSLTLIVSTLFIYRQTQFMLSKDVGIDKDQIVYFSNPQSLRGQFESFRNAALQIPGVQNLTRINQNPLQVGNSNSVQFEDAPAEDAILAEQVIADYDFTETLGIKLVAGRSFDRNLATDTQSVLINEALATKTGDLNPVGKTFLVGPNTRLTIIGIMKNVHTQPVRKSVEPMYVQLAPDNALTTMVRVERDDMEKTLADLQEVYAEFESRVPLMISHLADYHYRLYRSERSMSTLAQWFAGFGIVIACLGLFGLASFSTEQRTKEIGVRKVLGASVGQLIRLLTGSFTRLVLIAFVVAVPATWYVVSQWLQGFAYRIEVDVWTFAYAGAATLAIAWLTVFYQCLRAALVNPVEVLKYE